MVMHVHFLISETPSPTEGWPDRVIKRFICGGETMTGIDRSTKHVARINCPKCSAKAGQRGLEQFAATGHKVELVRVPKEEAGHLRSKYRLLINGVEYLTISNEYGWGKPWKAEHVDSNYHSLRSAGTRFERRDAHFLFGDSKEMVAYLATQRILADRIPSAEDAKRAMDERRAEHQRRMAAADAREAEEKAENRARLERALAAVQAQIDADPDNSGLADARNILAGLLQGNQYEI